MLQILTVCGAGLGSSFACQMSVEAVLKELGVEAKLDHTDISSVGGAKADIILSGKNFEKQFERYTLDCPTVFLDRLVDIKKSLPPVLTYTKQSLYAFLQRTGICLAYTRSGFREFLS